MKNVINRALVAKKKVIFTLMLTLVSSVWMTNKANWCMPAAQTDSGQFIRIGGSFQEGSMPPCPACLTIVLEGGWHYLASDDPQIVAILDTVSIGSFAIIEGYHYLERHADFINVTRIIFPETDIQQLSGEWEVSRETISSPTGDAGSSSFSIHDVNYTNYVIADNLIYKVVLDQASGYAHYSDAVPYTLEQKGDGTWLLTAEGKFDSTDPVEEGRPSPITIYQLTEDEMEWVYAANGGDEGPNHYYQYLKRYTGIEHLRINSLCDEWNVLEFRSNMGFAPDEYNMRRYHLTTDTIIAGQRYIRLYRDNSYMGAMREGNNRDIYYIPAGTTHEYLLYAFNAQIGDELTDLWLGRTTNEVFTKEYFPYGVNATVEEITETSPRRFVLSTGYITTEEGVENYPYYFEWIEGIGFASAPDGADYPLPYAGGFTSFLLCAYKNGEHIYTSDLGEQYGCEYNKKPINSLCDEWNVLYEAFSWPGGYRTDIFYLSTDTIINEQRYAKLVLNSDNRTSYKGAFREAENKNIYYYPAGSTHEYLLYAFNAQVGDTLSNLWIGGWLDTCPEEGWQGIVQSISNGNPRTFNVGIQIPELYGDNLYPLYWIEGVGSKETPIGLTVPPTIPVDIGTYKLLCAYKDGEQIYASQLSERFGCSYEGNNPPPVTDTIPIFSYTGDDPGSSTVDPVDPNQVVVTLKGDNMTVKESSGDEISMELTYITKNAPSERHTAETETFTNSVSVKLTEEGSYTITLTNPKWNYKVAGKFDYPKKHEGIGEAQSDNEPCTKVLRNGQLLIRRGNKLYNLQGAVITE